MWSVLTACLTGLAVTFAAARASGPMRDPDTLWHVNAGRGVLLSGRLVAAGPWGEFSSHTWVLHEWLSEVLMYMSYWTGGLLCLGALHALTLVGLAVLLLRLLRSYAGSAVGSGMAFITLFATSGSLGSRPQVASFVLLVVVLGAWLRTVIDLRPRWWLIPLSWSGACLHGLWLVGMAVPRRRGGALAGPPTWARGRSASRPSRPWHGARSRADSGGAAAACRILYGQGLRPLLQE